MAWLLLWPEVTILYLWEILPNMKHIEVLIKCRFSFFLDKWTCDEFGRWWQTPVERRQHSESSWNRWEQVPCTARKVPGCVGSPVWLDLDNSPQSECCLLCPFHSLVIIQRRGTRMMYIQIIWLRAVVVCSLNVPNANSSFQKVCSEFCWGLF